MRVVIIFNELEKNEFRKSHSFTLPLPPKKKKEKGKELLHT